eukprot:CAMPEP_0203903416 /NCGR_PEP_ID=MMETSP0359-20131031/45378_1 /ASSEMBLY_ACC=CAM_ASM_000338 /TAXON_ID=268821 /ORGANISM="Scrippsiella Hangoei, Strain SHTV-5" /LENGTH=1001 /DNA_ID=CAMNT_0050827469 /DNA_START=18 /DNA_END=3020 /DNA_ORIENTATION=-
MKLRKDLKFFPPARNTWVKMLGTPATERIFAMTFLPGDNPETGGDLLVSGTTETPWPEADSARDAYPDAAPGTLGHTDAWLTTMDAFGRVAGWQKQLRSPGDQTIYSIAAESNGGHAYVVGSTRGGFAPEVGNTPLVDFGEEDVFILKFTWMRAAGRCFRGGTCEADITSGMGLSGSDQALLANTRCGLAMDRAEGVPEGPGDGFAVQESGGPADQLGLRQKFRWGNKAEDRLLQAADGRYVLCWCAEGCDSGAVPQEVSVVFIIGPAPDQTKYCVVGEACDVTGIMGRDINAWDRIAVMPDKCGKGFQPGFPEATGAITEGIVLFKSRQPTDYSCADTVAEEMEGVTSNWGCRRINVDAGLFKLCFCTPREGSACEQAVDFSFDIGQLHLLGPFKDQWRRCASGFRCEIAEIEGFGLENGDKLLILDTCRTPQKLPAGGFMSIRGIPGLTLVEPVTGYQKISDFLGNFQDRGFGSAFMLGNPITPEGGNYRMCWCRPSASARGCTNTDDFAMDMGMLSIIKPEQPQYLRQCFQGQKCVIHFPDWMDGDTVWVLKSCPDMPRDGRFRYDKPYEGTELDYLIDGWPQIGRSLPAEAGGQISWGDEAIYLPVGRYLMCWCMGNGLWPMHKRCEKVHDFWIPIGEIEILGPVPGQHFEATSGHPVLVSDFKGYGLEQGDGLAVVPYGESCTGIVESILNASARAKFPDGGLLTTNMEPVFSRESDSIMDYKVNFSAGSAPVVQNGGLFALCVQPAQSGTHTPTGGVYGGYVFAGCGSEAEARRVCAHRILPMPKSAFGQRALEDAVRKAREAGELSEPCGHGIWLGGRWDKAQNRWEWEDSVVLSDGPLEASSGEPVVSPSRPFSNWAAGQPTGRPPEAEPWMYMEVDTGKWHDVQAERYSLGIVCRQSEALPMGTLRLSGPLAGHRFVAVAGRPLRLEGLRGVELRAGDFLLATSLRPHSRCGVAFAARALGGEGISYPSMDGTTFVWPGFPAVEGETFGLCW